MGYAQKIVFLLFITIKLGECGDRVDPFKEAAKKGFLKEYNQLQLFTKEQVGNFQSFRSAQKYQPLNLYVKKFARLYPRKKKIFSTTLILTSHVHKSVGKDFPCYVIKEDALPKKDELEIEDVKLKLKELDNLKKEYVGITCEQLKNYLTVSMKIVKPLTERLENHLSKIVRVNDSSCTLLKGKPACLTEDQIDQVFVAVERKDIKTLDSLKKSGVCILANDNYPCRILKEKGNKYKIELDVYKRKHIMWAPEIAIQKVGIE